MGSWETDPRPHPVCPPSAGLQNLPSLSPSSGVGWEGGVKVQDLFDPSLGGRHVCSCPDVQPDREAPEETPHFAEGYTEVAGSRRLLRKSPGRMGEEFPPFHNDSPSLQGAAALGAKGNSHPDREHFLRSGPSHSPEPSASRKSGTAAGRGHWPHLGRERKPLSGGRRRLTPPAEEGALSQPRHWAVSPV